MTTQEIVGKLWKLCDVLRDDGITYHQYVTELTYILFLKMAKETGTEDTIPAGYRWDDLAVLDGMELKNFYKELLEYLGTECQGRIREIYNGASTSIDEPANLKKLITSIDELDWFSAKEEGLGNLYEGLLQKNAEEKKSGAGQYFTPRPLIDVMTKLVKPQAGEKCNDKIIAELIQAHRARNTSNPYEIRGFEVFLHRIGETCIQVMDKDGDFCGFLLRGGAGQKAPRLYGAGICQSTICRVCKMGMKAGIKPVSSEFLTRGDGGENIARRCASVRKWKI